MKKKKKSKKRFGIFFSIIGAGLAISMVNNITSGLTYETVLASAVDDDIERKLSSKSGKEESDGIYDFKDNKTTGTVTVTKVWDDDKTNEERVIPDIKISTAKPRKSTLGYTVTFHGDKAAGLVFDDGSDINEVVYNSSGQIVDGAFKVPVGWIAGAASWFTDKALTNKVDVSEDGTVQMPLSGDIDLWGKVKTFEIKGGWAFHYLIPDTVTEIFFTDEIKPESASVIDVDTDGDGGVVAWTENNGTIMKVSTQIKGMKMQAAKNSAGMFSDCSGLTALDLSSLNTQNVTNMSSMFYGCSGLTALDLSPLNTQNVTKMDFMFQDCRGLTALDLSSFNTQNVTSVSYMFDDCRGLTVLDLSPLNTQNVTNMNSMFSSCRGLTALDLSSLNTQNVTNMYSMFYGCSGLKALDLSPLNTQNVTNMDRMLYNCSGLTALDLSSLNTQNVTNMSNMFYGCRGLTALDLSPLNTQNVTNMGSMFSSCSGLTHFTTGSNFKFVGTDYISGTWRNTAGETFTSGSFPSNVADTYTKVSY